MIISYNLEGVVVSFDGYRNNYTKKMIDALIPVEGYGNYRIYDAETIERVWMASDTGGTVSVELDGDGEVIGVITENGELDPPTDEPLEPQPSPLELLQAETAELWYENMVLEMKNSQQDTEFADVWFEIMNIQMGGM